MKMKNKIHGLYGSLLAALCLSAGCSSYEDISIPPAREGAFYISVDPSTYGSGNDLNVCESKIEKLRVFVFNSDGSFDNMISTTTLPVKVRVSAGTNKRVIAVANEPAAAAGYLAAANTVNGVQQVMYDLSDYLSIESSSDVIYYGRLGTNVTAASTGYTLPMYGEATGVNVTYTDTETAPRSVPVALTRSVARIDIYMRKKAGVTAVGKLLPATTRLGVLQYPGNKLHYPSASYPTETFGKGAGFLAPAHVALYDGGGLGGQIEFKTDELTIPAANPAINDRSDYLLCYSFYAPETDYSGSVGGILRPVLRSLDWEGTTVGYFPVGLGETVTPDGAINPTFYKLERNKIYRLFWTVSPVTEDIDVDFEVCPWEVEPVQTQPVAHDDVTNCYMIAPGEEVHIPLKQIYDAYASHPELGGPLSETAVANVELLWDAVSSPPDEHCTVSIEGTGDNRDKYIRVVADARGVGDQYVNPLEDNILIAFKLDSRIVWSFHIWVTNYNPNHPASQRTSAALPGVVMMDRCLGEAPRSNTLYYPQHITGLSYQWGRSVPFGVNPLTGSMALVPNTSSSTPVVNFADEFANPTTILENRGLRYNDKGTTKTLNPASLWYGENGKKTIYDPCPRGWKVMPKTVFDATGALSNFTYMPTSGLFGLSDPFYRHAAWGDFTMAGCLVSGSGWVMYGARSSMWVVSTAVNASGMVENCYWEIAPSLGSQVITPGSYATTAMVRCVKE